MCTLIKCIKFTKKEEENAIIFTIIQDLLNTIPCHKLPDITAFTFRMSEREPNLYVHMKGGLHTCWFAAVTFTFTFLQKLMIILWNWLTKKIFSLVAHTAHFHKCANAHTSQK